MSESIVEVRCFEFRFTCEAQKLEEKCGGQLRYTGEQLPIAGRRPMFKHMCVQCRNVKYLDGVFPMPMFLPINEPIPQEWHEKLDRENVQHPPSDKRIIS